MARTIATRCAPSLRVPHACGDGPLPKQSVRGDVKSSPRLWGWPVIPFSAMFDMVEFPTPVGMARARLR